MLFGLGAEIIDIDVAARVACHHHDVHADHRSRGRVGAVRRGGDQADLAVRLAAREVIAPDRQQPGVFALRAGVRLQRHRVIPGNVAQPLLQPLEQRMIALGLIRGRERMQIAERRPGQRDHLGRGVELHGAGAERDHRAVEREVAIAELAHVAQQLGLRTMGVEHRMGEEGAAAPQLLGQRLACAGLDLGKAQLAAEHAPHRLYGLRRRGLVERDAERGRADAQIDPLRLRAGDDLDLLRAGFDGHGVEERLAGRCKAELAQAGGEHGGATMHPACDVGQALGPVIDRIHRGDHGEQHLRGADVGGRLLAADMLLAGLQGEAIGRRTARIHRQADDAAGQRALQRVAHRHVGGVRSAIAHRDAEPLRRSDRDVGAELAGRSEQGERQQVRGHDRKRPLGAQRCDRRAEVAHRTRCARILQQRADHFGLVELGQGIADHQRPAQRGCARAHHRERLRMHLLVDEEHLRLDLRVALGERHRFRCRGCLVEQRGVGDVESGEVADHGLEVEQRFETTLADLRLIRRVRRVPGRVLQDVTLDHRGQDGAGIALADQRREGLVLRGELAHMRERLGLAQRAAEIQRCLLADRRRQRLVHQRLEARGADRLQHRVDVARRRSDVAADEIGGGFVDRLEGRVHGVIL